MLVMSHADVEGLSFVAVYMEAVICVAGYFKPHAALYVASLCKRALHNGTIVK